MPQQSRRVAIADADPAALVQTSEIVAQAGHTVVATATSAGDLANHSEMRSVELIIVDSSVETPGGLEAIAQILQSHEVPLVVTSAASTDEELQQANAVRPLALLAKPVRLADFRAAAVTAIHRFAELQALRHEVSSLRQGLEDRKLIERAKGLIMQSAGVSEAEAFARLQHAAREGRVRLAEIAKSVILSGAALMPPPSASDATS